MRPLRHFFDFRGGELPVAGLLFSFFFLVIATFQVLKPLKKGLFVDVYGADVELYAKLVNILLAALAVAVFTGLYNRMRRDRVIYVLCGFFVLLFTWFAFTLSDPGPVSIWAFYLAGDLETTFLVAAFWAYATDLASSDQAKRLFGPIGAGGVIGGWAGVASADLLLERIGMVGLLLLAAGFILAITFVTAGIERQVSRKSPFRAESESRVRMSQSSPPARRRTSSSGTALEGARLVLSSRYLAAIAGILVFYEVASQVMDYQFSKLLEPLAGVEETQAFIVDVFLYANILAVIVQLFLVSFILKRFGIRTALLILPLTVLAASSIFLALPTLYVASAFVIAENGLNYSIQQTSRETLFVPTDSEEKYKGRAFINMFLQRLAKGVGILAVMGLIAFQIGVRDLSWLTITVVLLMLVCTVYAAARFSRSTTESETMRKAA